MFWPHTWYLTKCHVWWYVCLSGVVICFVTLVFFSLTILMFDQIWVVIRWPRIWFAICCVYLRPANIWAALPVAVSTWVALGSNLICFANFVFFSDHIDQIWVVIRWPRICQHLSSLANGRQYLGCPGLKYQIEQSSSHMREIPLAAQWSLIAVTHSSTVFTQITVYKQFSWCVK